jgi:hypothetical protein
MGIPGDCSRLSVKIFRDVDRSPHTSSITSLHHDAMMKSSSPGFSAGGGSSCGQTGEMKTLSCVIIACTMVTADSIRMATFLAILATSLYNGLHGDHTHH